METITYSPFPSAFKSLEPASRFSLSKLENIKEGAHIYSSRAHRKQEIPTRPPTHSQSPHVIQLRKEIKQGHFSLAEMERRLEAKADNLIREAELKKRKEKEKAFF
jgi:hypothetical protein